jgi:ribosome-associated protein
MLSKSMTSRGSFVSAESRSLAAGSRTNPERSLQLALAAAEVALENGGKNIVVMDMTGQSASFDYFVVATGVSQRQLRAMSDEIDHQLKEVLHDRRMNIDGRDNSNWVVMDYGTVLVHLFDEITRQFYSIEALWADSPRLDLKHLRPNLPWQ